MKILPSLKVVAAQRLSEEILFYTSTKIFKFWPDDIKSTVTGLFLDSYCLQLLFSIPHNYTCLAKTQHSNQKRMVLIKLEDGKTDMDPNKGNN